jgi:hypothetical protein
MLDDFALRDIAGTMAKRPPILLRVASDVKRSLSAAAPVGHDT